MRGSSEPAGSGVMPDDAGLIGDENFLRPSILPLSEVREVRQIRGEGFRRWFRNDNMELVVWYADDIVGFQLCYDVSRSSERAMTWTFKSGYRHNRVDNGGPAHSLMTPILVSDGHFDSLSIANQFLEAAVNLEKVLKDFIYNKIKGYRP